jgi:hypothetical protein
MPILTSAEKAFLDVFLHEATTAPFFKGPATQALHKIGIGYTDITWISWAYNRECPVDPATLEWGHAAAVAPPLPWADRSAALRRTEEIKRGAEHQQALAARTAAGQE